MSVVPFSIVTVPPWSMSETPVIVSVSPTSGKVLSLVNTSRLLFTVSSVTVKVHSP